MLVHSQNTDEIIEDRRHFSPINNLAAHGEPLTRAIKTFVYIFTLLYLALRPPAFSAILFAFGNKKNTNTHTDLNDILLTVKRFRGWKTIFSLFFLALLQGCAVFVLRVCVCVCLC